MLDYFGFILSFILGFYVCKKKNDIICFFKALKFLYSKSKESQVYNDFFETNFSKSDFVKEGVVYDE